MTLADNILDLALPYGESAGWDFRSPPHYIYLNFRYIGAIQCMKTFWITIALFVRLPPDSVSFKGWFKPCSIDDEENIRNLDQTEPVSFSLQIEPASNPSIFHFAI